MTLSARGHVFQVKAGASGARAPRRIHEGAVFYGPRYFWSMTGQGRQRVEEYVVLPEGAQEHRARYEVPVLRMHYGVARDAQGLTRQGQTRLRGVVATHREPARYALVERTLSVELVLGLEGLSGPIVVDPGWSSTGTMAAGRTDFTATLLPGGKVLIAGGYVSSAYSATAELYDPASGTWSSTGAMSQPRIAHTMTLLPNGKVLVTGGYTGSTGTPNAELYDPATGTWTSTSAMKASRAYHSATVLSDGRVLVYTPPSGFAGTDTFTFKASDGRLESNVARVTVNVTLPSTAANAVYDSVLGAPRCSAAASSCDSVSLLNGRGGVGPERNQPNTIGPCLDGMAGAYHVNQSLDRLKVSSMR